MWIPLAGHSQTSDTSKVTVSKKDALKVLAKGYEAKALEAQRDLLLIGNDTLIARIAIRDGIILNLKANIADFKSIINEKNGIITIKGEERALLEKQIADKNSELKKQRRKTRFVAFVGTAVSSGLLYLFITKK